MVTEDKYGQPLTPLDLDAAIVALDASELVYRGATIGLTILISLPSRT
jgi:hypothetical protein